MVASPHRHSQSPQQKHHHSSLSSLEAAAAAQSWNTSLSNSCSLCQTTRSARDCIQERRPTTSSAEIRPLYPSSGVQTFDGQHSWPLQLPKMWPGTRDAGTLARRPWHSTRTTSSVHTVNCSVKIDQNFLNTWQKTANNRFHTQSRHTNGQRNLPCSWRLKHQLHCSRQLAPSATACNTETTALYHGNL